MKGGSTSPPSDATTLTTSEVSEISDGARKRAAVELIRNHERTLRRTARRYSFCEDDAEDAYQRSLEILLTKAPTVRQRDLIRWMQTVTKHEALAVRRHRERMLTSPSPHSDAPEDQDWVQLIPSQSDGPADQVERRERVARSREALATLKPQELRALTLLAEGYSYREIGELTGWTRTKINRCLAEGRQRFRSVVAKSEGGDRCDELAPILSAFADDEAPAPQDRQLREHLRVCAHCRSKLKTYRVAPRAAGALAPTLPLSQSLGDRLQEALVGLQSRLPWRGESDGLTAGQIAAAGGTRGAGTAVLAKVLAACVGTAGGAAACVATGVIDSPINQGSAGSGAAAIEQSADRPARLLDEVEPPPETTPPSVEPQPEPAASETPVPETPTPGPPPPAPAVEAPAPPPPEPPPSVEFTPEAATASPPPPAPTPAPAPAAAPPAAAASSTGSGAGEFGP